MNSIRAESARLRACLMARAPPQAGCCHCPGMDRLSRRVFPLCFCSIKLSHRQASVRSHTVISNQMNSGCVQQSRVRTVRSAGPRARCAGVLRLTNSVRLSAHFERSERITDSGATGDAAGQACWTNARCSERFICPITKATD